MSRRSNPALEEMEEDEGDDDDREEEGRARGRRGTFIDLWKRIGWGERRRATGGLDEWGGGGGGSRCTGPPSPILLSATLGRGERAVASPTSVRRQL